ncbi:hypothetical protein [Robertmurraya korlensis]|uniref:hypothetical protein n=1 Tax=Robertmurraya korlensis TaxID=519977 RepID=UPI0020406A08|nr:hypothetical protein [Robertmurraya korlensis]
MDRNNLHDFYVNYFYSNYFDSKIEEGNKALTICIYFKGEIRILLFSTSLTERAFSHISESITKRKQSKQMNTKKGRVTWGKQLF